MGALGQELSAEQVMQIVIDEVGPCWSRWADDCMNLSEDLLREHGLYAGCEPLRDAAYELSDEQWYGIVDQVPYCGGFFDYADMPKAGGHPSIEPALKTSVYVTVGAAVGMMVIGIAIGRATK